MTEIKLNKKLYDISFYEKSFKAYYNKKYNLILKSTFKNNKLIEEYLFFKAKELKLNTKNGLIFFIEIKRKNSVQIIMSEIKNNILEFQKILSKKEAQEIIMEKQYGDFYNNVKNILFLSLIDENNIKLYVYNYKNSYKDKTEINIDIKEIENFKYSKGKGFGSKLIYFSIHTFFIFIILGIIIGKIFYINDFIPKEKKINYIKLEKYKKQLVVSVKKDQLLKEISNHEKILKNFYNKTNKKVNSKNIRPIIEKGIKEIYNVDTKNK